MNSKQLLFNILVFVGTFIICAWAFRYLFPALEEVTFLTLGITDLAAILLAVVVAHWFFPVKPQK